MVAVGLEGVTVLADDVAKLAAFFEHGMGFEVAVREDHYVAFATPGVRLAIFERSGMAANTGDHPTFRAPRGAQAFELNFECASVDEVQQAFDRAVAGGGTAITAPFRTEWGHVTGFFADPEGNIHSVFAVLPD